MSTVKQMVDELLDAGFSQSSLARALETSQPTIHRITKNGADPGYELGKRIEALYSESVKPGVDRAA